MKDEDVISSAVVPGWGHLFIVGSLDSRITFFSQQVRALNLVDSLVVTNYLGSDRKFAVIGAGAAGLATSAALALLRSGAQVDLFERQDRPLHLQHNCTLRHLHPHIYDWPEPHSLDEAANLPILDWTAGRANIVAEKVDDDFRFIQVALRDHLNLRPRETVTAIVRRSGSLQVISEELSLLAKQTSFYDAVFLAIGFGFEKSLPGAPSESYWSDRSVPGDFKDGRDHTTMLVSGAGDGGLIDLSLAALPAYDHQGLVKLVTTYPAVSEITDKLIAIDRKAAASGSDFDFMSAYDADIADWADASGLLREIRARWRPDLKLIFNTKHEQPLWQRTATLNRVLTYLLFRAADGAATHLVHRPGLLSKIAAGAYKVGAERIDVDRVLVRHGPDKAAAFQPFAEIFATYTASHERWLKADATRAAPPRLTERTRANLVRARFERRIPPDPGASLTAAVRAVTHSDEPPIAFSDCRLRQSVLPIGRQRPRPVNLLMPIGLDRHAAIAVTIGVDGFRLAEDLKLVEAMIASCGQNRFAPRIWTVSQTPDWPSAPSARGLVWCPVLDNPSKDDLVRALAGGFRTFKPDCGDVLVIALPTPDADAAEGLVEGIRTCGGNMPMDRRRRDIPIYAWSHDQIQAAVEAGKASDPRFNRLLDHLAALSFEEADTQVRNAYEMRRHAASGLSPLWLTAKSETFRIHDLSVLLGAPDQPSRVESERALELVSLAKINTDALHAFAFLPITEALVKVFVDASAKVRGVVGLISSQESQATRLPWPVRVIETYRPMPESFFVLQPENRERRHA